MYTANNAITSKCQSFGPSMTTVEIAALTDKRHDNVFRDARKMLIELYCKADALRFEGIYHDTYNREKPCYRLPKKEILVLVSGYSVKLRMKIVTRLEELERTVNTPMMVLNDPAALRQILITYSEKVICLEETVNMQAPKVAALDRLATADGSMCITAAAKHLQVRPKDLFRYLSENRWVYRRNGNKNYLAYQGRIQQGLLEHKITTQILSDGSERVYEQARVTPKGLARLSEAFEMALV